MSTSLIGQPAPDFELNAVRFDDHAERQVTLAAHTGRWLILLFYPRDFSIVCPSELTAFSARMDQFRSRGCDLLAVSVDSIRDHLRWFNVPPREGGIGPLQFPLASDPEGKASQSYGVWMEVSRCSARALFIIDPAGILQYSVAHNASVGRNVDETLRVLDALQSGGMCPASWTSADGTINVEELLQPGRVLGNFRLDSQLGAGAFGRVFAADDLLLQRRVAIKVVGRKASTARENVLAEARSAARLHHRNICTIFTVDFVDSVPLIVMELIDGQPLSRCNFSTLNKSTRWNILQGMTQGLAAAHVQGVIHGDLKPANIMITCDGEAKLLDFGLSRQRVISPARASLGQQPDASALTMEETVIGAAVPDIADPPSPGLTGTLAYMSPELTYGQPASPQSDLFAFGLIVVLLLTDQLPVKLNGISEVLAQIRNGDVRRAAVAAVPERWKELVEALLADRPEDRPSLSQVQQFLQHHPEL